MLLYEICFLSALINIIIIYYINMRLITRYVLCCIDMNRQNKYSIILKVESDWWDEFDLIRLTESGKTMLKLFKFNKKINMKQQRLLNDWNELMKSFNTIDIFSLLFLSWILIETLTERLKLDKSFLNMWWRL